MRRAASSSMWTNSSIHVAERHRDNSRKLLKDHTVAGGPRGEWLPRMTAKGAPEQQMPGDSPRHVSEERYAKSNVGVAVRDRAEQRAHSPTSLTCEWPG